MDTDKQSIREWALKSRKLLSPSERSAGSGEIFKRVVKHPVFLRAAEIFIYVDCKGEADTHAIIEAAWQSGKRVAVPKVTGNEITFYYISDFSELTPGHFDVPEPSGIQKEAVPGAGTLILMPGVAFDSRRNRIGYGKGYYDRYLSRYPDIDTLAIAFSQQLAERIPASAFDVRPDILITDTAEYC